MALRGENIGTAYVRILADGTGLDKSVRDEFRKAEPAMEQSGERTSQKYSEGFQRGMVRQTKDNRKALRDSLSLGRGEMDARAKTISSNFAKELRNELRKSVKGTATGGKGDTTLADTIWNNLMGDFRRTGDKRVFSSWLENLPALVEKATAQIQQTEVNFLRDREAAYAENNRRILADMSATVTLLNREVPQFLAGDPNATGRTKMLRDIEEMRGAMRRLNIENANWSEVLRDHNNALRRINPQTRQFNLLVDRSSGLLARAFGKGSRNDFVNFVGSMVGGMARLPRMFTLPIDLLHRFQAAGRIAFDDVMARTGDLTQALAAQRRTLLATFGKGMVGVIGGFAAGFAVLSPIISVVSLLAGTVAALASTLGMGLIGAVGAAAGSFAPLIAGIGVAVLAFTNMDREAKRAFRSIGDEFEGLGKIAAEGMFQNITEQARRFNGALQNWGPTVRRVGTALSRVGDNFLDLMEGRGFQRFQNTMQDFLPGAVEKLGNSMVNAFGGMTGLLNGLAPITQRFLTWLENITEEFSGWANSVRGQAEIRRFMKDAGDSAAELGGFLGAVSLLLGQIISQGNESGDNLFRSMTDTINGWTSALQANPDILNDWFDSAESFGKALGGVVVGLGKVFDALDNTFGRNVAVLGLEALAGAINGIGNALRGFGHLFGVSEDAVASFATAVGFAAFAFPKLNGAMTTAKNKTGGFISGMRNAETRMETLRGAASAAAGMAGMALLADSMGRTAGKMKSFEQIAGGALAGFAVGGPWGAAIGAAVGGLKSWDDAVSQGWEATKRGIKMNEDYAATFDQITGAITRATRQAVFKNLQNDDTLTVSRMIGIPDREMIDATLGDVQALERIRRRVNQLTGGPKGFFNKQSAQDFVDGIRYGNRELTKQQREFLKSVEAGKTWGQALRGLPKGVKTKLELLNYRPTIGQMEKLVDKYNLTPKQVDTMIKALGVDLTKKQIKDIKDGLDKVHKTKTKPKVELDDKPLDKKHREVLIALRKLNGEKPTPKADLDKARAAAALRVLNQELNSVDARRPKPVIDLQWSAASRGVDEVQRKINALHGKTIEVRTRHIEERLSRVGKATATGGLFNYAQTRLIGEAGPEAVVPLNRPLGQVDPAVRWLSAIAQGKVPPMASGGVVGGGGRTVEVGGISVYSPNADPEAVAAEVVNKLVAVGY